MASPRRLVQVEEPSPSQRQYTTGHEGENDAANRSRDVSAGSRRSAVLQAGRNLLAARTRQRDNSVNNEDDDSRGVADSLYTDNWRDGTREYQNRMVYGSYSFASTVGDNPSSSFSVNYDEPYMPGRSSSSASSVQLQNPYYNFGRPLEPPSTGGAMMENSLRESGQIVEGEFEEEAEGGEQDIAEQHSRSYTDSLSDLLASFSSGGGGSGSPRQASISSTSPLMSENQARSSSIRSVDNNISAVHYYDDPDLAKSSSSFSNKMLAIPSKNSISSNKKGESFSDTKDIDSNPAFITDNGKLGEEDRIYNQYSFAKQSVLSPNAALSMAHEPPIKPRLNSTASSGCNWRRHWLAVTVCIILLVHGIFALSVFLSKIRSDTTSPDTLLESDNVFGTFAPSASPQQAKSIPPVLQQQGTKLPANEAGVDTDPPNNIEIRNERLDTIQGRIHKAVPGDKVLDETSMQYSVVKWLAIDDPYQLSLTDTPLSVLLERYVSVLLFYATGGNQWVNSYQFMTNRSVCEWNAGVANSGIYCDERGSVEMMIICKC